MPDVSINHKELHIPPGMKSRTVSFYYSIFKMKYSWNNIEAKLSVNQFF